MADTTRPISRRARFEVLRRDGHTCRYCGAQAPDVPLTVDHVIPRALGGSDDPTNLVTACQDCNAGKSSTSPDEHVVADVDAAALLFARAIEKAAEIRRGTRAQMDEHVDAFNRAWMDLGYTDTDGVRVSWDRVGGWRDSIARFIEGGLDDDELARFASIAVRSQVHHSQIWRYFCGICWREIGNRQELARQLIEDGEV